MKNYGEFCDVKRASQLTLTLDGSDVKGELIRALDGKAAKIYGKLKGNIVSGTLSDTNSFTSKFIFTGRMQGNVISGSLAGAAWNGCGATFRLTRTGG